MKTVVIVGGGAAGLAAAYALERARNSGVPVDWMLLEKDGRLGGKIWTEKRDGFIIDGGPDCYLTEKPWVAKMAERLGIADHLLPSDDDRKKTYIYSQGRLHELPDGVWMVVPTKFMPFVTTSLFSWPGKIRMGMDLVIPRGRKDDETLAEFVKRRLGTECLEKLAEPMVGGVHASDPYQMSLKATFPRFLQMEQKYGSLIRAFLAARKSAPPAPSQESVPRRRTYFTTFRQGMQEITDAMADAVGRAKLLTGVTVTRIDRSTNKPGYVVRTAAGADYFADAVIVSAESYLAAQLVEGLDKRLAELLNATSWTSAGTVSLAYKKESLGRELDGFGFLVPAVEKRKISACTWSSTKWPGRAPYGHVLLRVFVGGAHNQQLVEQDDDEMIRMVRAELRAIMGISAEPEFWRVFRWLKGMPQYTIGHLERLEEIETRLLDHTGLYLCGASYRGVGTGDVMNSGEQAAEKAIKLFAGRETSELGMFSKVLESF